jgi:hypothetical protein
MKRLVPILILLFFAGCSRMRLVLPDNHLPLSAMSQFELNVYHVENIKSRCGKPDIIDFHNNVIVYISKYEEWGDGPFALFDIFDLFKDRDTEYWYLVLHTDSSEKLNLIGSIYYEKFEAPSDQKEQIRFFNPNQLDKWPPQKRETYQEITTYCAKIR